MPLYVSVSWIAASPRCETPQSAGGYSLSLTRDCIVLPSRRRSNRDGQTTRLLPSFHAGRYLSRYTR